MRKSSQIFNLIAFKNLRIVCLILILLLNNQVSIANTIQPFWRKPELIKKMAEDQAILVSVTHEKPNMQSKMFKLYLKGAGIINAPQNFNQKKIVEYEKLSGISTYIREVKYTPEKQELFVHGVAYSFIAKMVMKMTPIISDDDFKLGFEVIRGHFTGMKGVARLEDYERRKSLMSLEAYHEAEKVPLPAALLDFGLEIVLQQVAKKIRQHLESEFKKEKGIAN